MTVLELRSGVVVIICWLDVELSVIFSLLELAPGTASELDEDIIA